MNAKINHKDTIKEGIAINVVQIVLVEQIASSQKIIAVVANNAINHVIENFDKND